MWVKFYWGNNGERWAEHLLCATFLLFDPTTTYRIPSCSVSSRTVPRWASSPARSRSSPGLPHVPDHVWHEQRDGRCFVLWHDACRRRLLAVPWRWYQHRWTIRRILTRAILPRTANRSGRSQRPSWWLQWEEWHILIGTSAHRHQKLLLRFCLVSPRRRPTGLLCCWKSIPIPTAG